MANIVTWVEQALGKGEHIKAVVIGGGEARRTHDSEMFGQLLSWDEAAPILNYRFNSGHGEAGCHAVFVWTNRRVLFIQEYDGATDLYWVPRKPTACVPKYCGFRTEERYMKARLHLTETANGFYCELAFSGQPPDPIDLPSIARKQPGDSDEVSFGEVPRINYRRFRLEGEDPDGALHYEEVLGGDDA